MEQEKVNIGERTLVKVTENNKFVCWRDLLTCTRCGEQFIQPTEGHYNLYCEKCAVIVRREKTKERTRRYRERKKQLASS